MLKKKKEKWCPKCERFHALEKFSINRGRVDGLAGWCKRCISENNRRLVIANNKKWKDSDPYKGGDQ